MKDDMATSEFARVCSSAERDCRLRIQRFEIELLDNPSKEREIQERIDYFEHKRIKLIRLRQKAEALSDEGNISLDSLWDELEKIFQLIKSE